MYILSMCNTVSAEMSRSECPLRIPSTILDLPMEYLTVNLNYRL